MSGDLETASIDSLASFFKPKAHAAPPPGTLCRNCQTELTGRYCAHCGQSADTHHRSILHLAWEAVEGLLHLDGRLAQTLPALFFRPGTLARDYMEGRIARHVPPFRTFLVALLLFIFAAEQMIHHNKEAAAAHKAEASTPAGRASMAQKLRAEAKADLDEALSEAARDRDKDLKSNDPDDRAQAQKAYAEEVQQQRAQYATVMSAADKVQSGEAVANIDVLNASPAERAKLAERLRHETTAEEKSHSALSQSIRDSIAKIAENPEYYISIVFNWGHRAAVLLLPIVGGCLTAVYATKRQFYVYDHLVVAMNFLSFIFLTSAVGMVLPEAAQGHWFGLLLIWTPVNLFMTLRGAYGSSILGAGLKTLFVWAATALASSILLTVLLVLSVNEL